MKKQGNSDVPSLGLKENSLARNKPNSAGNNSVPCHVDTCQPAVNSRGTRSLESINQININGKGVDSIGGRRHGAIRTTNEVKLISSEKAFKRNDENLLYQNRSGSDKSGTSHMQNSEGEPLNAKKESLSLSSPRRSRNSIPDAEISIPTRRSSRLQHLQNCCVEKSVTGKLNIISESRSSEINPIYGRVITRRKAFSESLSRSPTLLEDESLSFPESESKSKKPKFSMDAKQEATYWVENSLSASEKPCHENLNPSNKVNKQSLISISEHKSDESLLLESQKCQYANHNQFKSGISNIKETAKELSHEGKIGTLTTSTNSQAPTVSLKNPLQETFSGTRNVSKKKNLENKLIQAEFEFMNSQSNGKSRYYDECVLSGPQLPVNKDLFRNMPKGVLKESPVVVLDSWRHGDLIWWNRYVANRKRTQGLSVGNFIGRVVDIESEWFPSYELVSIKSHLKTQATSMGRRSVCIQALGEMKYMVIPPRAIAVFPDPNIKRQTELLNGLLRCNNSAIALRGFRRAQMIEEIRASLEGQANSLYEIEFLDICMRKKDSNEVCNVAEVKYLNGVSVWEFIRSFKTINRTKGTPFLPYEPSCNVKSKKRISIADNCERNSTSKLPHIEASTASKDDVASGESGLIRRTRKSITGGEITPPQENKENLEFYNPTDDNIDENFAYIDNSVMKPPKKISFDPQTKFLPSCFMHSEFQRCIYLCKQLYLTRSEIIHLLRGVPATLLVNQTGIPLPEEIPQLSVKILENTRLCCNSKKFWNSFSKEASIASKLPSLHFITANSFIHKLFRTILFRISLPEIDIMDSGEAPLDLKEEILSTRLKEQLSTKNCEDQSEKKDSESRKAKRFSLVFSQDHCHHGWLPGAKVNMGKDKKFILAEDNLYETKEPVPCLNYKLLTYNPSERFAENKCHTTSTEKPTNFHQKHEKKSVINFFLKQLTLRAIGIGSDGNGKGKHSASFFCANMSQMSDAKHPSDEEWLAAADIILGHRGIRITLKDLKKRVEELNLLKETASQLRNISENVVLFLRDAKQNHRFSIKDCKHFESLWSDLLRKIKTEKYEHQTF